MALSFNSAMIGTDNLERLSDFYTKALGKPSWEDQGFVGWQVGSGGIMLGTHSEVKGQTKEPARIIMFLETKDVQQEFDRLKAAGAEVIKAPYDPGSGGMLATLADPDGNYFQLATPWEEEAKS